MWKFRVEQKRFEIGTVKIGGLPGEHPTVLIGSIFYRGQKILKNDMQNYLKARTPGLAQDYKDAATFHKKEVVPYHDKRMRDMATGKVTDPRNVTTLFKNPEKDVRKVVGDLGQKGTDQILYNELYERNPTPEKILDNYAKLDERGIPVR